MPEQQLNMALRKLQHDQSDKHCKDDQQDLYRGRKGKPELGTIIE